MLPGIIYTLGLGTPFSGDTLKSAPQGFSVQTLNWALAIPVQFSGRTLGISRAGPSNESLGMLRG